MNTYGPYEATDQSWTVTEWRTIKHLPITQSGLDQFQRNNKIKTVSRTLKRLMKILDDAKLHSKSKSSEFWLGLGWVVVVRKGLIRTIYRPIGEAQQRRFYGEQTQPKAKE